MFQNPAALWGLVALVVPVLVHLFNFRPPRRILFSQTAFLQNISQAAQSRNQLKRLLLLASRLLAIACIVMVFAGPILPPKTGTAVVGAEASVLVWIDDSPSMALADERGTYLQQAKDAALAIVGRGSGSVAGYGVQPFSKIALGTTYVRAASAAKQIQAIQTTDEAFSLQRAFAAFGKMEGNRQGNTVLYILSDFQRSTVLADSLAGRAPANMQVICLPVGSSNPPNTFIKEIKWVPRTGNDGTPNMLRVTLASNETDKKNNVGLRLLLQGKEVGMATANFKGSDPTTVDLPLPPQYTGWLSGEIRLEDQPQRFDHRLFFSVYVPAVRNLLVVYGTERSSHLQLLLQQLQSFFKVTYIREQELAQAATEQYDGIILYGITNIGSSVQDRLGRWVQAGGGLWVLPTDGQRADNLNLLLRSLRVAAYGNLNQYDVTGINTELPETESDLLKGIFSTASKSRFTFDGFTVRKQLDLELPTTQPTEVPLRTADRKPFLAVTRAGQGVVFVASAGLAQAWGNFAEHHAFAPVVYRILTVMTQPKQETLYYTLGQEQVLRYASPLKELVTIRGTDNASLVPEQYAAGGMLRLQLGKMDLRAGNYGVWQKDTLLAKASFNIPVVENDLRLADDATIRSLFDTAGWQGVIVLRGTPQTIALRSTEALQGVALWKYFLVLAAVFLATEAFILWLFKNAQVIKNKELATPNLQR